MAPSKAGGKKQLSDANLPDAPAISSGILLVTGVFVPAIAPQVVSTSELQSAESTATSEISVAPAGANGVNNGTGGIESSPPTGIFSSGTISPVSSGTMSPVDTSFSQAVFPASDGSAAKMVTSQNDSSRNSAATVSGLTNSAGTPLASNSFDQTRPAVIANDQAAQLDAQAGIASAVVINGSGHIDSPANPARLSTASAEWISSLTASASVLRPNPTSPASAQSNFGESHLSDRAVLSAQNSLAQIGACHASVSTDVEAAWEAPQNRKIGDADVTPPAADNETPSSSQDADALVSAKPETQPTVVNIFSEQDAPASRSGTGQPAAAQASCVGKDIAGAPSSPTSATLASVRISEVILAGAPWVENPSNPAPMISDNEPANDIPISKASSPTLRTKFPGILSASASNTAQNNDASADSNPVKAINSAGQTSDATASAQSSQAAPAKPAPGKADGDTGNPSPSPLTDANTASTPGAAPAPIATAAATSVAPPQDGNSQNAAPSPPSSPDSTRNSPTGQASVPVPSDPPAVRTGAVQMAQMVNKAAQSEMRVELNTSAFGGVEVRTTVRANDVGVLIGSEKGDLRSLLANELPGIASNLQQQDLRLNQVSFHQGFASANQMSSGGGGSQSRSFASRSDGTTGTMPEDVNPPEFTETRGTYAPSGSSGKLSVLA